MGLEPIPAAIGQGYTLDQSITGMTHIDIQPFTLTLTPMDNLE